MRFHLPCLSFKIKSLLLLGLVQTTLLAIIIMAGFNFYYEEETEHVSGRLTGLASSLAITSANAIIAQDLAALQRNVKGIQQHNQLVYVRVHDHDGRVLAAAGENHALQRPFNEDYDFAEVLNDDNIYDMAAAIEFAGQGLGRVELGLDIRHVNKELVELAWSALLMGTGILAVMILLQYWVLHLMTRTMDQLKGAFHGLVQGEASFSTRLNMKGEDEFAQIGMFFDLFMGQLEDMVKQIMALADGLSKASQKAQDLTASTSASVEQQAQAITAFTRTIEHMANSSEQVNQQISETVEQATGAQEQAQTGRKVVESAMDSMQALVAGMDRLGETVTRLASRHADIRKALDMIEAIAEQTNLLALNAAIEAARAGEHGRGFAVVADEVRNLSQRTTESTAEIQALLEAIRNDSEEAVATMGDSTTRSHQNLAQVHETGATFDHIVNALAGIRSQSSESAQMASQQQLLAREIHDNITEINANITNLVTIARQNISDNSDLAQYSVQLAAVVGHGMADVVDATQEDDASVELF